MSRWPPGYQKRTKQVNLAMSPKTWERAKELARPAGFRSGSDFVIQATEQAIRKFEGQQAGGEQVSA